MDPKPQVRHALRALLLVALLALSAAAAGAQSQPKDLAWALGEFSGDGPWRARLPLLIARGWSTLPEHRLSEAERAVLKSQFLDATLRSLEQQESKLRWELDKKRLLGPLPSTEPEATRTALAALASQTLLAREGRTPGAEPPQRLGFRAVWPPGQDLLPWSAPDPETLATQTQAVYVVTGAFHTVGGYLSVEARLYSRWEHRDLADWQGQFAPEEAPDWMAAAAGHFREALLGRPWAGVSLSSPSPGARVKVAGVWHSLPWSSDDLDPGEVELTVQQPGQTEQTRRVVLKAGERTQVPWELAPERTETLVLETTPPGASLYLDSRYLGPSPQTVPRPLAVTRIRAEAPGWASAAWEVGPHTVSPSIKALERPSPVRPLIGAKDQFYWSLAGFSASLTASAFLGAWFDEQVQLTAAYGNAYGGNPVPGVWDRYTQAYDRAQLVRVGYAASVVLTTGVFVWMMVELGDYLGVAQASLP